MGPRLSHPFTADSTTSSSADVYRDEAAEEDCFILTHSQMTPRQSHNTTHRRDTGADNSAAVYGREYTTQQQSANHYKQPQWQPRRTQSESAAEDRSNINNTGQSHCSCQVSVTAAVSLTTAATSHHLSRYS